MGIEADLRAMGGVAPRSESAHRDFVVRRGQRTIDVGYLSDNDDDVTGLVLYALYDRVATARRPQGAYRDGSPLVATRPLAIELRAESIADVSAKERGLTSEWQSGDPEFDREVYVCTPTTDAAVLGAVLNAEVRAATRELLGGGFARVLLDVDGRVEARLPLAAFSRDMSGESALAAFERMLDALPPVTASGAKHPRRPLARTTRALAVVGGLGCILDVGFVGSLEVVTRGVLGREVSSPSLGAWALIVLAALGAGVGGATVYSRAVAARARGRSDSVELVATAEICAFGAFSVIGFSVALVTALAFASGR